ncbi:MAG: CDP-alcohol phosphatidyltransferase family protein [Caldilineaceae bacterium]|nr:CDP-alcohol phosphatidyltransferase family protein [Caldilineaceae bacterium]
MPSRAASDATSLGRLQTYWWGFLLAEIVVLISCYWYLSNRFHLPTGPMTGAERWLVLAGLVIGVELWLVRRNLGKNHRRGEKNLLPTLGIGNALTLIRGLAYALMAGFLFAPRPDGWLAWAPAILYSVACFADFFDGYLARITDHTTVLGEVLDIEFDGLGILIGIALAIQYGQLPWIYLLVGLGRPLFVWGLRLRAQRGLPEFPMTPSANRRIVAGVQMGFMMIVLWPVFAPPLTTLAALLFGGPIVVSFLRDWFVVIGRLDPASESYRRVHGATQQILFAWLPVFFRYSGAAVTALILWRVVQDRAIWFALPAPFDVIAPGITSVVFVLGAVAALTAVLGVAGRITGVVFVLVACVDALVRGLGADNGFLLITAVTLVMTGTGRFALWTPEEYLFNNQTGRRR